MTNEQHEREAFEAWAKNFRYYEEGTVEASLMWQAWQAARANSGWLPIESANKEQIEQVLLYNGEYYVGGWANDRIGIGSEYLGYTGEGWYTDNWQKIESPTLWQPITPPKTGE